MRKQVQKERCTKIMLTKCKAVCCLYDKVQLAAAKMLDAEPAIFQFEYSRTFAGSAAIFHVLLTPGWGLYFFFSPAGAKPANRFGGDLKVYF